MIRCIYMAAAYNWTNARVDTRLPVKRTLIAHFLSVEKLGHFNMFWASKENQFYSVMKNHSVVVFFPHIDADIVARNITIRHQWVFQGHYRHDHAFLQGTLQRYKTPHQTEVFLQSIIVHLPRYYLNLRPAPPMRCGSVRLPAWSLSYAMYSGAVFSYHMMQLPLLKLYDYVLKLDSDIGFLQKAPADIGAVMQKQQCIVAHTSIIMSTTCEAESVPAIAQFAQKQNLTIASINRKWCNGSIMGRTGRVGSIFYGNFLAFSTSYLLDQKVVALAKFLYEDWDRGYFLHRWGDQAPFTLYVCLNANIFNLKNSSLVCNLKSWRHTIFEHGPRQRVRKLPAGIIPVT